MSELTDGQKLLKLGIRSVNQTQSAGIEVITKLQNNIASEWAAFQENFEDAGLGSWDDFEVWLGNNGIGSFEAANIRQVLESKYGKWSNFSGKILNDYESWADFEDAFASNSGLRSDRGNGDGNAAAGVKVYEEAGYGRSGQAIPAGGVEVYGAEVHFSETEYVAPPPDDDPDVPDGEDPLEWSNLTFSANVMYIGETIQVSADIENKTSQSGQVVAGLLEEGEVIQKKTVELTPGETKTVTFDYRAIGVIQDTEVGISKAGTDNVYVTPPPPEDDPPPPTDPRL